MIFHAPQMIYLALVLIGVGVSMAQHGKPKTGNHHLGASIIGYGIVMGLLYWGGFFSQP